MLNSLLYSFSSISRVAFCRSSFFQSEFSCLPRNPLYTPGSLAYTEFPSLTLSSRLQSEFPSIPLLIFCIGRSLLYPQFSSTYRLPFYNRVLFIYKVSFYKPIRSNTLDCFLYPQLSSKYRVPFSIKSFIRYSQFPSTYRFIFNIPRIPFYIPSFLLYPEFLPMLRMLYMYTPIFIPYSGSFYILSYL